jgi:hypothetical protein
MADVIQYILQENGEFLFQENGDKLIIDDIKKFITKQSDSRLKTENKVEKTSNSRLKINKDLTKNTNSRILLNQSFNKNSNSTILVSKLDQHSFRFRSDDDDEETATWLEEESTNITRGKNVNTRLRFLIDSLGNPTNKKFQLEFRKKGDEEWKKL